MVSSALFDDFYPLTLGEIHDPIWLKSADFQHLGRVENPPSNRFRTDGQFQNQGCMKLLQGSMPMEYVSSLTLQLWDGATWRSEAWTEWIWRGFGGAIFELNSEFQILLGLLLLLMEEILHKLRLVVSPIFCRVLYIQRWLQDFVHQQYYHMNSTLNRHFGDVLIL